MEYNKLSFNKAQIYASKRDFGRVKIKKAMLDELIIENFIDALEELEPKEAIAFSKKYYHFSLKVIEDLNNIEKELEKNR